MPIRVHVCTVAYGRMTNVLASDVRISQAFHPPSTPSPPSHVEFIAIWDTGATNTVITQKVIDDCKLKPIGMAKVNTAQGEMNTPAYLASIVLPNNVCFSQLRVTRGDLVGTADVLIGMDVIGQGDFAVTNKNGKTTFSFRVPSIERIDFVEQRPPGAVPGTSKSLPHIGRNDPCPCGSGKKYKRCCGK